MEEVFDWGKFYRKVVIKSDMTRLYETISTPNGITKWFIKIAEYESSTGTGRQGSELIQSGDSYEWTWVYKNHNLKGEVLKANGLNNIEFTFGPNSTIDFLMEEHNGGNILLTLTQVTGHTDERANMFAQIDCFATWTFFLNNLKSILEGGIDLRDTNPNLEGLINR